MTGAGTQLNRWMPILLTVAACSGTAVSTASAHHPTITEFQTGLSLNNGAWDLVSGGEGQLWFTEDSLSAFGPLGAGDGLTSEFTGLLGLAGNPARPRGQPEGNHRGP